MKCLMIALPLLLSPGLATAVNGVTKDSITFGSHTSLSGPAAVWGVASVNGLRLRFDEENKKGGVYGRKLKIVVEDHQYQVPKAIQAVNKLINRDKVFAMVGALGTPMNNAVMKRQFAKGVPNLFPYTSGRSMFEPYHDLKLGAFSSYYQQVRRGVRYFAAKKKKTKICAMYQDTDYGQEIKDAVDDELKAQRLKLTAKAAHKPTEISFDVPVAKLKDAGCQVVVLGTIIKDTIQIVGTAKKMGWKPDFMVSLASYDGIVARVRGGITEGLYSVTPYVAVHKDTKHKGARAFFAAYEAAYKKEPGVPAQFGYIFADMVVEGLKKAGKNPTPKKFMDGMRSLGEVKVRIQDDPIPTNPKRDFTKDASFLSVVKGGRWEKISRL